MSTSPRFRLLAIHAHPDDESSKGAATMARYSDEGHQVRVLTCTGGERGDILNPKMGPVDDMVATRHEEMAKAASILGVEHCWLGYVDSGLPEGDPLPPLPEGCFALVDTDEAVQNLVAHLRAFRPHVVITYDENGGYPHPDHIKVHAISMRAWDAAADPNYHPELGPVWEIKKLYYTHGFVSKRFELIEQELATALAHAENSDVPRSALDRVRRWKTLPDIYPRVTTRVEVGDWFERRDDALRAHATQVDPDGPFFIADLDIQRRVWPTEEFELAKSRVDTELPETDLFAGLDPEPVSDHGSGHPTEHRHGHSSEPGSDNGPDHTSH